MIERSTSPRVGQHDSTLNYSHRALPPSLYLARERRALAGRRRGPRLAGLPAGHSAADGSARPRAVAGGRDPARLLRHHGRPLRAAPPRPPNDRDRGPSALLEESPDPRDRPA